LLSAWIFQAELSQVDIQSSPVFIVIIAERTISTVNSYEFPAIKNRRMQINWMRQHQAALRIKAQPSAL
jgi:hypothetical protein